MNSDDLVKLDLTEISDLVGGGLLQRLGATASNLQG